MTKTEKDERRQEAIAALRKMLRPGDMVYCVLRHVSKSGMSRGIDFYVIKDNKPRWITGYLGQATDTPQSLKDWQGSRGLRIQGCGMVMGFHMVYNLGSVLFPKGFKVKGIGRNGDTSDHDNDGGYALKSQWL